MDTKHARADTPIHTSCSLLFSLFNYHHRLSSISQTRSSSVISRCLPRLFGTDPAAQQHRQGHQKQLKKRVVKLWDEVQIYLEDGDTDTHNHGDAKIPMGHSEQRITASLNQDSLCACGQMRIHLGVEEGFIGPQFEFVESNTASQRVVPDSVLIATGSRHSTNRARSNAQLGRVILAGL